VYIHVSKYKGLVALCHSFCNLIFFNNHSHSTITHLFIPHHSPRPFSCILIGIASSLSKRKAFIGCRTEYISLQEMKQGQCICPLSWSVHCNFIGDGKCNERGWACTPHPHQPRLILPSWLNVRQKADVTTLCTLWGAGPRIELRPALKQADELPTEPRRTVNIVSFHKLYTP
jgi:hypothetical protein